MVVARLVARIGPDLCSSDESDPNTDMDDSTVSNEEGFMAGFVGSGVKSWRGTGVTRCLTALRTNGLYYGRHASHLHPSRPSKRPPPDGTPLSWIADGYVESLRCS
jgi:hypothetical protein